MEVGMDSKNKVAIAVANGTNAREARPEYWVAALVRMNTEKKVCAALDKMGVKNYLPVQTEIHQWSDRKKKVERVVIPMIVFAKVNEEYERQIRTYSFINKLISYPGQTKAAHIPDEQIENLQYMLKHAETKVEVSEAVYEVGEDVEIVRGYLKGLCGKLCYFDKNRPMVGIYIDMLGYACVNVDKSDIKIRNI